MSFPRWLLLLPAAASGVRVASRQASADPQDVVASTLAPSINVGKVEGKVIRCTAGGNVVFEQAEENSTFTASLGYAMDEDTGTTDWAVTIPGIFHFKVDSGSMMAAQLGHWFVPQSYEIYPIEVDPAGKEMQQSLSGTDNWVESLRIIRGSDTTIKVVAQRRRTKRGRGNVEIEFTGGPGPVPGTPPVEIRVNLPALEYFMPMQGNIVRMKVDGKTVFDEAYSKLKFPVVCTPAFLNIPNVARDNRDAISQDMWAGFQRWRHATVNEIDVSPKLTMRSNNNTVEISGNGTEVVFSKEKVEGKVTKCIADGSVVFDKAEADSAFRASWEYVDEPGGTNGWAIMIPNIVQL